MRHLRVLILSQYFPPEVGATQARLHTFAAGLANEGHDVEVICEVPNHPQGIVHDGYRRRPFLTRQRDGYRANYVWVLTGRTKTRANRLAFYASYALMATARGLAMRRPDVVLASSPPLPVAAAAAVVARRHRVPWVMDVRDLWPEAAVALGMLSSPAAIRLAEWLERWLYEDAAAITAVTEPFRQAISKKTSNPGKISLVPNGTTRFWLDGAELDVERGVVGLSDETFIWTYAGNVGPAQGLESAIDAAGLLGDGFRLLILGDGPSRAQLEKRAVKLPPGRVIFRGQVDPRTARSHLRASDCLLVPLASDPALSTFVPSKLFDFCAVGRPVVLAASGEAHRLAVANDAALGVPPGEPEPLARAVRVLREDAELRSRVAAAGRRFAEANLREASIGRLSAILEAAAENRPT